MRKFITILCIGFLAFATSPHASGHVEIVNSFPEQFANVNPIPKEVWIEFSGNLQTLDGQAVNSLEVIDSTGIDVNYEDAVISGGRITTKISGQSAPGAFTVKYRVVGDDGHVIEGDYTFNASPDYSAEQSPMPISSTTKESSIPAGGILLGGLLVIFFASVYKRAKNRSK
jgi:methionine-rich copper-binding protein CopC